MIALLFAEAPPFVPTLSSSDDTSNFIDAERKKSTPQLESKDHRREFSGKHLPFIGFTFSQDSEIKTGYVQFIRCGR